MTAPTTQTRLIPTTITCYLKDDTLIERPIPAEPISDHLAVTPFLAKGGGYTGGWSITHLPTGLRIPAPDGCLRHIRQAADVLLNSDVDWSRTDPAHYRTDPVVIAAGNAYRTQVRDLCYGPSCQ